jgi:hypothetical protein
MVKVIESVLCSYTWWGTAPHPTEKARLEHVGAILLSHGTKMYCDALDPTVESYHDEEVLLDNWETRLSESGLWLAIIANKCQASLLTAQARIARSHDIGVIVAYQDETDGSLPALETLAKNRGGIYCWENDHDLREIVREEVLPMCDNNSNDFNTEWTPERKTA